MLENNNQLPTTSEQVITADDLENLLEDKNDSVSNPDRREDPNAIITQYDLDMNDEFKEVDIRGVVHKGTEYLGDKGYGDSQWDEGATYQEITSENGLAKRRAALQPWTDQAANFISQVVVAEGIGGTMEGVGYLMDWEGMYNIATGKEKEYSNWFSELGGKLKETVQDNAAIYERTPGGIDMFDTGFWFKNGVSIASTLSIMIPGMAGAKALRYGGKFLGKGLAKGVNAAGKVVGKGHLAKEAAENGIKLGVKAEWMADGMTQAIVSRHIENTMEAHGTMEGIIQDRLNSGAINKDTGLPYTEEEARKEAAVAASENYRNGWAMVVQDMFQYLAIGKVFNPVTKQMEVARRIGAKTPLGTTAKRALSIGGSFASEAAEEGYQNFISTSAHLKADLRAGLITEQEYHRRQMDILGSDESKISMLFGGLGGSVFDFAGPKVNELLKSKSRKELEAKAEKWREMKFKDQFQFYSALHKKKQEAESKGDMAARQMIQDDILTSMIIDGIDNNNLEEVMNAILEGKNMTPEQQAKFLEEQGGEWNQELAEEGANRALEMAKEIKELHFKNRGKKSNKGVPEAIIKDQTLIEFRNRSLSKEQQRLVEQSKDTRDNIKFDNSSKPSQEWMDGAQANTDLSAQDAYISVLKRLHKEAEGSHKEVLAEQLKVARSQKRSIKKKIKGQKEAAETASKKLASDQSAADKVATKNMTPAQKKEYMAEKAEEAEAKAIVDKNNREAYDAVEQEMLTNAVEQKINGLKITLNNNKAKKLTSKEYQTQYRKDSLNTSIRSLETQEEVDAFEKMISKDEFVGSEYTDQERADMEVELAERKVEIKREEKARKKAEENKNTKEELANNTKEKNNDLSQPDNNVSNEVSDVLEDQHKEEEIQHEEVISAKEEHNIEVAVGNGKAFSPLDNSQGTLKAYTNWLLDGTTKVGTVVGYRVANRGPHKNPRIRSKTKAYQAIVEFDNAVIEYNKTGVMPKLSDNVIDHYPIELFVKDGSENGDKKKVTDIASLDSSKKSADQVNRYNESTRPERTAILNALLQGKEPTSVITHSGGGQLQTEMNSDGTRAVNGIREVEQFSDPESDIEIVYTNERGEIMNSDKKDLHPDFLGTTLSAGRDDADNSRPYSGGVFVIVKKADGTPFPVKLNNLKNTEGQANALAKILLGVAVPPGQKDQATGKYPKKELSMDMKISDTRQELQDMINDEFADEMEMLGPDATISDLLGVVTFLSDKTEGMTTSLMFKGVRLSFGAQGNEVTPENINDEKIAELTEFLRNVKSRPFSLKRWNDTRTYKGYRNYVIDNKVVNTDMVTSGPLFKSSEPGADGKVERRVQIYVEPLAPKTSEQSKSGKNLAEITEDVNSDDLVNDPTAAAPKFSVEANKEIANKFPGKNYHYGIHDGKTVFGVTIPDADLKAIKEIQDKFAAKGKAVVSSISTTNKSMQVSEHTSKGGSTFTADGKNLNGTSGFSVSTHIDLTKSIPGKKLTEQDIADFIESNKMLLGVDPSLSISTRYNEKTNTTMIDVVSVESDPNKAIALGKKHNQIAIYDLKTGETIETGETGVSKKSSSLQSKIEKRITLFVNSLENAASIEEEVEATTRMMNTVSYAERNGATVDSDTKALLEAVIDRLEAQGYTLRNEIGRELSENERYDVGISTASNNVPEGVTVVNAVRKPFKSDSAGVRTSMPVYDIIVGTGTSKEKEALEEELDDAFNSINPLDLENTRDRHDKAKAALKEYNDRVFPKENRLGKDDGSNDSAIEELNNSLSSELQDAKEQMDFEIERIDETDLSLSEKTSHKNAARARYVEAKANINSKESVNNSKPEAPAQPTQQTTKAPNQQEQKSAEMKEMENNGNIQFSLFENKWDAIVDGKVVASDVTKETAVEKASEHKEASKKVEDNSTTVTHSVNGRSQEYSVKGGVITNSKGKEVFAKSGKNRTAILDLAENSIAELEKSLEPVVPVDLTDQEWQDFTENGIVSDSRLRALVAKEESGAVIDLKEQTILDSKLGRINKGKGNVSENGDTKISKADKKAVSSQTEGSTTPKLHSNEVNLEAGKVKSRRKSKRNRTTPNESTTPTLKDINGTVVPGKEDTTC